MDKRTLIIIIGVIILLGIFVYYFTSKTPTSSCGKDEKFIDGVCKKLCSSTPPQDNCNYLCDSFTNVWECASCKAGFTGENCQCNKLDDNKECGYTSICNSDGSFSYEKKNTCDDHCSKVCPLGQVSVCKDGDYSCVNKCDLTPAPDCPNPPTCNQDTNFNWECNRDCLSEKVVPDGQKCQPSQLTCINGKWDCNNVSSCNVDPDLPKIIPEGQFCSEKQLTCNSSGYWDCNNKVDCNKYSGIVPDNQFCDISQLTCETDTDNWDCENRCDCNHPEHCPPQVPNNQHCTNAVCKNSKDWGCNNNCLPGWEGEYCNCEISTAPITNTCNGDGIQIPMCISTPDSGYYKVDNAYSCIDVENYARKQGTTTSQLCSGCDGLLVCDDSQGIPKLACQKTCPAVPDCKNCDGICTCDFTTDYKWTCSKQALSKGGCPPLPVKENGKGGSTCIRTDGSTFDPICISCGDKWINYCQGNSSALPFECIQNNVNYYGNIKTDTSDLGFYYKNQNDTLPVYPVIDNEMCMSGKVASDYLDSDKVIGQAYKAVPVYKGKANLLHTSSGDQLIPYKYTYPYTKNQCLWQDHIKCKNNGIFRQYCGDHVCTEEDDYDSRTLDGYCECTTYIGFDGAIHTYTGDDCSKSVNNCFAADDIYANSAMQGHTVLMPLDCKYNRFDTLDKEFVLYPIFIIQSTNPDGTIKIKDNMFGIPTVFGVNQNIYPQCSETAPLNYTGDPKCGYIVSPDFEIQDADTGVILKVKNYNYWLSLNNYVTDPNLATKYFFYDS